MEEGRGGNWYMMPGEYYVYFIFAPQGGVTLEEVERLSKTESLTFYRLPWPDETEKIDRIPIPRAILLRWYS